MQRTKISDVAKAVGVSETTVSLVLTNKPNRISIETREKIINTANELNYVPNAFARGLATNKSDTIGLIVPDIENSYFASLSKEISKEAEKYGYIVLLLNSDDSHLLAVKEINKLLQRNVDGIILVASNESYHSNNVLNLKKVLSNLKTPYVLMDRDFSDFKANKVYYDNIEGGYLATKHLIDNGHRKIACITGPNDSFSSLQRLMGYKKALKENNIPYIPSLIIEGDFRLDGGIKSFNKIRNCQFDSIFCFNDMMAFGAMMAMKNIGLSVPKDLSIVGYDNSVAGAFSGGELDSINQDAHTLAKESVQLLMDTIDNPKTVKEIKLKPNLVVRNSVKHI